jgi:serine beta-lactamase-like protein LACTB, mitochondrial
VRRDERNAPVAALLVDDPKRIDENVRHGHGVGADTRSVQAGWCVGPMRGRSPGVIGVPNPPKSWIATTLALVVVGVCLLAAAGIGLWTYMGTTAVVLHPTAQDVPSVTRAAPPAPWADAVDQARRLVRTSLSAQNLPGFSVAIGIDGELLWAEGFGWSNAEQRARVTPETTFRIGTASAVLTSAAVGLLLEQGRLTLDDEIQTAVPAFPRKEWPVTLRHLMAHVAGVRSDGGDESPLFEVACERPVEALPHFADRPLLFEPGTAYHYSNYGWIAVSAAVEAAAGEPFLRVMRKRIFEPLRMDDTAADDSGKASPDRATFYFPRFSADPRYGLDLMRDIDLSCYAGAGVFLSTASDLVRFGLAVNGGTLLQPATVALLQTSQRLTSGEETGYGLGWDLERMAVGDASVTVVGHDGDVLGGQVASLLTVRDRGLVVAVLSNSSYADTFTVAADIARSFLRNDARPPSPQ